MAVILGNTKATVCAALTAQFLLQPQKIANTFFFFLDSHKSAKYMQRG